jgi:hypothetical protein
MSYANFYFYFYVTDVLFFKSSPKLNQPHRLTMVLERQQKWGAKAIETRARTRD